MQSKKHDKSYNLYTYKNVNIISKNLLKIELNIAHHLIFPPTNF